MQTARCLTGMSAGVSGMHHIKRGAVRPTAGCVATMQRPVQRFCNPWTARSRNQLPRARVQPLAASRLEYVNVADAMTQGVIVCSPDTTVDEALVLLVENHITGLPVVDDANVVVGVVSDFDLLALDTLGKVNDDRNLFPEAELTWQAFKEFKTLVAKGTGKRVKDVMTKKPICVKADTCLEEATRLLLQRKIRRLPVVDENGKLVGLLSRGNIIRAALQLRLADLVAQPDVTEA